MPLQKIIAGLGLSGAALLSEGLLLQSQILFCLSNPLLAYTALKSNSKPLLFMYIVYTFFSFRGVLNAL